MKKFLTLSVFFASLPSVFAQVASTASSVASSLSDAASTVSSTAVSVGDSALGASPVSVGDLTGGGTEYRNWTPEMSFDLLSVSAAVGFESEYVFRGERRADASIQPKVELAYPLYGVDLYVGAWSSSPVKGDSASNLLEVDLYGGVNYTYKFMKFDVGYIFYWYPSDNLAPGQNTRDMEVYVGFTADTSTFLSGVNVNPSVYYYYNWILKQNVVEVSLSYATPVGSWLFSYERLTLPVNVYGGYLSAAQKLGDIGTSDEATYWYYGGSVNLALAITDYCTISGGVRYSQRTGGNESTTNDVLLGREKNFWFGGKVDFGF